MKMEQKIVKRMDVPAILDQVSRGGKIFRVVFIKRTDGQERAMVCRRGVKQYLKHPGADISFTQQDTLYDARNLMRVFDVQKREYRSVPVDAVIGIAGNGNIWAVG